MAVYSGTIALSPATAKTLRLSPAPVRRLAARGAVQAPVVFDGQGNVFVADMAGWVQGFDSNGSPLWQAELTGGISASPAIDIEDRLLFIGTHAGCVHALRTADGAELWRRELPSKADPRILSDLLYLPKQRSVVLSSWGGQFHALDAASGVTRHAWDAGLSPQSGAAIDDAGNILCLRAVKSEGVAFVRVSADGKEEVLHRRAETSRGAQRMTVAAAPVVDQSRGAAYFCANGDRDCELHAWSLRERRHLWKKEIPRTVVATPVLAPAGNLLIAGMDGTLYSIAMDGASVYRYDSGAEYLLSGPVCSPDGRAFLGDPLGRLHVVDPKGSGRTLWESARSIQATPAFDRQGNLYVPSTDRAVHIFENQAAG